MRWCHDFPTLSGLEKGIEGAPRRRNAETWGLVPMLESRFRLSRFLPPSPLFSTVLKLLHLPSPPSTVIVDLLKQRLHYDPDSEIYLKLQGLVKGLCKNVKALDGRGLLEQEGRKGIVFLLLTLDKGRMETCIGSTRMLRRSAGKPDEVNPHVLTALLRPATPQASSTSHRANQNGFAPEIFPDLDHSSPLTLARPLYKHFIHLGDAASRRIKQRKCWCEDLLALNGCEEDIECPAGKGETLLAETEYEDSMNETFETSERSDAWIQNRLHKARKLLK
ncbi:hypothetical protein BKA70DRAFT_1313808 [Coprinopsis sp. MPI-PUGE-AT-0042]|nr:hypothetical protein BKA70DRAFT_1313808 [Coprinopsis sp. MPI-PUGE-AT-0042]